MNIYQKRALEYVRNTGGGATVNRFIEDWEPVGEKMWRDAFEHGWVEVRDDNKVYLTNAGRERLEKEGKNE